MMERLCLFILFKMSINLNGGGSYIDSRYLVKNQKKKE